MEKHQKNKKQKEKNIWKKIKITFALFVSITIITFFLIKIINAVINGANGFNLSFLTTFNSIGLIPPTKFDLPNIIDYVANIILLIILPILVMTWIIIIFKFRKKEKKKLKINNKQKIDKTKTKLDTDLTMKVEDLDIDPYPHYEEDKTFFEELNNEVDNDLTLLQQRAKSDGSILIKENLSELVKNANKIRNYAILNNIEVEEVLLEEMTKKELILFMKKIGNQLRGGDELRRTDNQNLNLDFVSVKESKITFEDDIPVQLNAENSAENFDMIEDGKRTQKKFLKKNKITKKDLIDSIFVVNENMFTKVKIKIVVDKLFELMESNLIKEGSEIKINNFGKFSTILVNETAMSDPKTGQLKRLPSRKAIKFKTLKGLKESLNKGK